jgi:hypothetical protein
MSDKSLVTPKEVAEMARAALVFLAVLILSLSRPVVGQDRSPSIYAGGHIGLNASNGDEWRMGAQMLFRVYGPVGLRAAFNRHVSDLNFSIGRRSAWQAWLSARVSLDPWWYVGTGITLMHESFESHRSYIPSRDDTDAYHIMVSGFELPVNPVRPFAEIHGVGLFGGPRFFLFFMGVNVRLH